MIQKLNYSSKQCFVFTKISHDASNAQNYNKNPQREATLKNKGSSLKNVPFALFPLLHRQLKIQLETYLNARVVIEESLKALS